MRNDLFIAPTNPEQEKEYERRNKKMDIQDKINNKLAEYYKKTANTSAIIKMAEKDAELGKIINLIKELRELLED